MRKQQQQQQHSNNNNNNNNKHKITMRHSHTRYYNQMICTLVESKK